VIGDNVFIGAGATLIGEITVGNDVFIGVHAIVTRDVPSGSRVISTSGIEVSPRREAENPPPAPTQP
jgi:serine O-acetyltransferase